MFLINESFYFVVVVASFGLLHLIGFVGGCFSPEEAFTESPACFCLSKDKTKNCDGILSCISKSVCENGYFGQNCLYIDAQLADPDNPPAEHIFGGAEITDDDKSTCTVYKSFDTITVDLKEEMLLHWFRFQLGPTGAPGHNPDGNTWKIKVKGCNNERRHAWKDMVDIRCETFSAKSYEIIFEDTVELCRVFTSAGRNIVLNNVALTDTGVDGNSTIGCPFYIVDGNTEKSEDSCIKLSDKDSSLCMSILDALSNNANIYGFKITPWNDALKDVEVKLTNEETKIHYTKTYADLAEETVEHFKTNEPRVDKVCIETDKQPLSLCEFEVYGEDTCSEQQSSWGPSCAYKCYCQDPDEECFQSSGGCESGCAEGIMGINCALRGVYTVTALPGESAVLPCLVGNKGKPVHSKWYKEDEFLNSTDPKYMSDPPVFPHLKVNNLTTKDTGRYSCKGKGIARQVVTISVKLVVGVEDDNDDDEEEPSNLSAFLVVYLALLVGILVFIVILVFFVQKTTKMKKSMNEGEKMRPAALADY